MGHTGRKQYHQNLFDAAATDQLAHLKPNEARTNCGDPFERSIYTHIECRSLFDASDLDTSAKHTGLVHLGDHFFHLGDHFSNFSAQNCIQVVRMGRKRGSY